ncbi:MAG: DNA polymerase III subunit delta [Gammaproteobacteria bacterium MedPE]|nr:MAG: DNA polymerase III subunit delta [Gammaproteobacteria bacterium MedPE]
MRIYVNQVNQHLSQLAPVYMVLGDEPLQKIQTIDAIRQSCSQQGFDERISLVQDPQFSWQDLNSNGQNLSLFSNKQLIELELTSLKPGQEGAKAINEFLAHQSPDTVLLIHGPKATAESQKAKWFKALDAKGIFVQITQPEGHHFVKWLEGEIAKHQLNIAPQGISLLSQMFEGNLLAASQEIEKLSLQVGQQMLDVAGLKQRVTNQSRFSLFELQDALLEGYSDKALKILVSLQREEIEPQLLFWAFNRELTLLINLKQAQNQKQSLAPLYQQARVWATRQKLFETALRRLSLQKLLHALSVLSEIEQSIKLSFELPWDKLTQLTLNLTGDLD